ncbi:hypothetical protein [Desulfosporosinus fructosivorans]|uniref:hypothetical protein n=1 Tax=Desulfosporosinus fructosivorans TaxID=2018669 RepID=UPI001FB15CA0|nr:hypothetical protein [Desulfosporosinus fructosivorans]
MTTDELVYIKIAEVGSVTATIGYILLVISCLQSERVEIFKRLGMKADSIDPTKITAISAWVRGAGIAILAFNNAFRFRDLIYKQIFKSNEEEIRPQLLVTIGSWILLIGIIIIAIVSQQKAEEPGLKSILG